VFSEPVDEDLAIERFYIEPEVEGTFRLSDSQTLEFVPLEPFDPDITYSLELSPGPLTNKGALLKRTKFLKFGVRPPLVVYLAVKGDKSRLWTIEPDNGKTNPLTDETLRIFDFDASRDGEFVIFSAFNEQQGIDLWRVDRTGNHIVPLLQCGPDRCSVPAISPDSRRVAYVREAAGPSPDLQFGAPRIWIVDLESGEDAPLYEDEQIVGYKPVWSPDGVYLSSFNGLNDEIRLLNLDTNEQFTIPSQKGNPITWSADSTTFVYTDTETKGSGFRTLIREADLVTRELITVFGQRDDRDYYYNSLAWSPVEDELIIGLRFEENSSAEALWLMDPVTLDGQVIASQTDYVYNNPYWDPWGKAVIFQRFNLRGNYKPEIALWMPSLKEPRILGEGLIAHWLP
jgi:WD40 repeat protein